MSRIRSIVIVASVGLLGGSGGVVGQAQAQTPARAQAQTQAQVRDQAQARPDPGGPQELHPEATEAISRLRSPWCPGLMLEVCPSPEAAEFRDSLQAMAGRGIESDSLVEWALGLYGEEWRAVPQTEGTGLFAWIIPPLAILSGIAVVVLVLRKLRGVPGEDGSAAEDRTLSEEDERMLEAALQEMDGPDR